jgi:predicted nucleic-acid-binding protein
MSNIKQFRPICLLNISFKIFTKVTISRLTQVVDKLISQSQTVFVPSRNIIEGVVILHETIHELHRKKMNGVILKLNFKKAYDKMK